MYKIVLSKLRLFHTNPRQALANLGIDWSVTFALLGNLVSLLFGPITAFLIVQHFSPELQGYYYAFGSLLSLRFLGEIGFSQAIIQFASHEWADLSFAPNGLIIGSRESLSRFASLVNFAFKWYGAATVVLIPLLIGVGVKLFSDSASSDVNWMTPWVTLCIVSGLSFLLLPIFALLQGCGEVRQFWFYRFVQQIISSVALWIGILLNYELWSTSFAIVCTLLWGIGFLAYKYRGFVRSLIQSRTGDFTINWRNELWPVQWRIAVAWLGATFTAQMLVPIVFRFEGPIQAGQIGLTITLSTVIYAISTNWVVTKAPRFGVLIAKKEYHRLDALFRTAYWMSLAVSFVCVFFLSIGVWALNYFHISIASRILPPMSASTLLFASIAGSATTGLAIYLRAHKREPLAKVYFFSAILILTLAIPLAQWWGVTAVVTWYVCVLFFLQLPWASRIFVQSRQAWHKAQE